MTRNRPRIATVWLGGCAGCHMSFLDLDERLIDLAHQVNLVYSPILDIKDYPEDVDVALVEGAVANEEHLEQIRRVRERTRLLVAFGDCAVTGNVTALRNPLGRAEPALVRAYIERADERADVHPEIPSLPGLLPALLDRVLPIQEAVPVDVFLPGCPPSPDLIAFILEELIAGRTPDLSGRLKYG